MSSKDDQQNQSRQSAQPDLSAILANGRSSKAKSRRWLYASVLGLVAIGSVIYLFGFSGGTAKIDYVTESAKRGDLSMVVTSTGSVQPTDQVDISSELSGTVRNVNVNFNSEVKAGDVLADLDTNKLEADLKSAQAKLASAKASVLKAQAESASAKNTMERRRSLFESKVSSQQDLDSAQFAFDSANATLEMNRASVLSAEADLQLAEVNLQKSKILSPIDGVILTRSVDPGATVASSLNAPVLFTIAGDLRQMELQVAVDEADVGKVKSGQTASFNVDAYPERQFPATIESLRFASEVVANVVTYKAILTVDNAELLLRPGMTATANITVDGVKDALLIPNAALRFRPATAEGASRQSGGLTSLFRPNVRVGGPRSGSRQGGASQRGDSTERRIFVLRAGEPVAVPVTIGLTDGRFTSVQSEELKVDDLVITEAVERSAK
jgi:HlyD family secretion protein